MDKRKHVKETVVIRGLGIGNTYPPEMMNVRPSIFILRNEWNDIQKLGISFDFES